MLSLSTYRCLWFLELAHSVSIKQVPTLALLSSYLPLARQPAFPIGASHSNANSDKRVCSYLLQVVIHLFSTLHSLRLFWGMGIPRLTSHLQPYATLTNLGCNTPECSHHHRKHKEHNIFIDGPGLAYHVYYRALSQSPAVSNAYDAAPSYSEIGQATIAFLHELESYGLLVYAFIERQHFIVDAVAKASAVQEFTSMATSRPTKRESGSAA